MKKKRNIWHSHFAWNSNNKLITKTRMKKKKNDSTKKPKKCFVLQNSMNYSLPFQWTYCTLIRFWLFFLVSVFSGCCCCLSRVIELEDIVFVNHCMQLWGAIHINLPGSVVFVTFQVNSFSIKFSHLIWTLSLIAKWNRETSNSLSNWPYFFFYFARHR